MKRKVRKDFDPSKEYRVNVKGCTEEEKKEVQRAFFDVGFLRSGDSAVYRHLDALQYTNTNTDGITFHHAFWAHHTEGCNMTSAEFLELVYEPEQQGHVHADLMAQYAEDAKTTDKPWELWQVKCAAGIWHHCQNHPKWEIATEYRRKPKTKMIHGTEVPDLSFTPKVGEDYYYICLSTPQLVGKDYHSKGCLTTKLRAVRGLCYPDTADGRRAAILHGEVLLNID